VSYVRGKGWIGVFVLVVAGLTALVLSLRSDTAEDEASASDKEPAQVEPIKGTDLSRVTLTEDAARRLGIETAPVRGSGAGRRVIPYSAVLYDAEGHTFTYTSPERLVFVRREIGVDRIDDGQAYLSNGPPSGSAVVTVGSPELFGTEYEVEED
jgi:hypothetical protein